MALTVCISRDARRSNTDPVDTDIATAARRLSTKSLLRGEPRSEHIIDLAGHASQFLRQLVALEFGRTVFRLFQNTINVRRRFRRLSAYRSLLYSDNGCF